jgi:glyoxylase-like metal-dependent hydrolase (beta-lactamase superfamily II)
VPWRTSTDSVTRALDFIRNKHLTVHWIRDIHVHADHTSGAAELKKHPQSPRAIGPSVSRNRYRLLDVGYAEEFDDHHMPGAILMPLYECRDRMDELDKNQRYIVYYHARGAVR